QGEYGIPYATVTGVQTCALPIAPRHRHTGLLVGLLERARGPARAQHDALAALARGEAQGPAQRGLRQAEGIVARKAQLAMPRRQERKRVVEGERAASRRNNKDGT